MSKPNTLPSITRSNLLKPLKIITLDHLMVFKTLESFSKSKLPFQPKYGHPRRDKEHPPQRPKRPPHCGQTPFSPRCNFTVAKHQSCHGHVKLESFLSPLCRGNKIPRHEESFLMEIVGSGSHSSRSDKNPRRGATSNPKFSLLKHVKLCFKPI